MNKCKIILVPKHHTMKSNRVKGRKAVRIFNLGTRCT